MLKLKNVILNIEYSPSYGAKSVLTGTIVNYSLLPRIYTLEVYFIKGGRIVARNRTKGIVFRTKNFSFETNIDVDEARVYLKGMMGIRVYDRKLVHPA